MAVWRVIWLMSPTLIAAGVGLHTSPLADSDAAKVLEDMEAAQRRVGWAEALSLTSQSAIGVSRRSPPVGFGAQC